MTAARSGWQTGGMRTRTTKYFVTFTHVDESGPVMPSSADEPLALGSTFVDLPYRLDSNERLAETVAAIRDGAEPGSPAAGCQVIIGFQEIKLVGTEW